MGSSMAENHPVGFQWVIEAREKNGAKIIHVDPRFTRTSAMADYWLPLRAGSDIVFLGALVNYVLENERDFREYVVHYTNAATILREDFRDTEDLGGLFSGWDAEQQKYDPESWLYEGAPAKDGGGSQPGHAEAGGGHGKDRGGEAQDAAKFEWDTSLQHPRCVFQVLKRHFSRYTPEMVERVCGVPREQFLQVCADWTANSGRERTAALIYSVGWTQHTVGAQNIRAGAIVQLLLGNIGRPGGGIYALRGHANIQGSTDIPTLFDLLPGYLPMPRAGQADLPAYLDRMRARTQKGYWEGADAYLVSLLKEYFGDAATADNDFGFGWLPRINGDHGTYRTTMDMIDGRVSGYFVMGQNPAVGSANGRLQRLALANLDWLVVRDLTMIETASFWKDAPEIETGEIAAERCRTEVFFFPAASHVEKAGSFTQTQRMVQWRQKGAEPTGDQRSDLWFFHQLWRRIRDRVADSTDPRDVPLQRLAWDYRTEGSGDDAEPDPEDVLRRINGVDLTTGRTVDSFTDLRADGTTACGCWQYSGIYKDEVNQAARRKPHDQQGPYDPEWGWTWPANRRLLYNRASADLGGRPWSERKKLVWWDADQGEWTGEDIPDFPKDTPPGYVPPPDAVGARALRGDDPFIMQSDGKGWLFAPHGLVDGPLPTHYEPHESPVRNLLYAQQGNPTSIV